MHLAFLPTSFHFPTYTRATCPSRVDSRAFPSAPLTDSASPSQVNAQSSTAADLCKHLSFLVRQLKPMVLTRDWARTKRDEWEAVLEACSDLGCFHGLLEVMKRDGVDFKAAAATVKPPGSEEETASHDELLARLLESKV
jgi:hypothetical protein